jgi:acetate kinase
MKNANILSVNGGSSSIKFVLYKKTGNLSPIFAGSIKRIGETSGELWVEDVLNGKVFQKPVKAKNISEGVDFLVNWFEGIDEIDNLNAIGHRIVHGMNHSNAVGIDDGLMKQLTQNIFIDPDHLPGEIDLVNAFKKRYPQVPQVACFDTAFHTTIPRVASMLPIPRRYEKYDIHRYGFHGISYSYLMEVLEQIKNINTGGRIILAHLGNGASLTAVKNKKSVDTSMGFTPAGGFLMGTRSGDLDPGVVSCIMKRDRLSVDQFNDLINHESGMLGISETSSDMQDLLKMESSDERAADAINMFCYQVKKWIGSFSAALDGLDILVFSGGIGENAVPVRRKICEGLQFLGIELDQNLNDESSFIISGENSRVLVYVIPTNEELMIAKMVCRFLSL